jgi:glutamate-ammonia-ligase adenylyltransferase
MRLRPNGDSGPLVGSLGSLENYFIAQGREWERYAWIKARVMNQGVNLQPEWVDALHALCRPFVFRKYLDFGAINAMRDLHAQIRREVARKDMAEHIKLGPGGIREIEFIAQVFQLIRGGREPALQIRPTLQVLALLVERRLLPAESAHELTAAYDFLRRLEHRLQYVGDAQTHRLPSGDEERRQIARSMAHADWPGFLATLDAHRGIVGRHFEQIFSEPEEGRIRWPALGRTAVDDDPLERLSTLGFRQPRAMLERLHSFRESGRYLQLPASNRERLDALGPRLIDAAAATTTPDATWQRGLDFLDTISRRGAYLALLQQYPQALMKLAELIGSSSWAADYLTRHPILLDELLDSRIFDVSTDWQQFQRDLQARLAVHVDDTEREMDILREAHHAQVFHLLAQDIAGMHTVEHLADRLSELADIMVQTTLDLCWQKLRQRHPHPERPPQLRGHRLRQARRQGTRVRLRSRPGLSARRFGTRASANSIRRLGQRMSTWMSTQTAAGMLFEVDLRLRPNGDSGMLVCPIDAFRDYQLQHAWVWEHQALTRARFCAGDPAVGQQFEAIRIEILRQPRDLVRAAEEVLAMRKRMLDQHASGSDEFFDIKHDRGGLIDVEFIVQYLVLGHAHRMSACAATSATSPCSGSPPNWA